MAMAMAAAAPAVPGALGEYPQPNQVEMAFARLARIAIVILIEIGQFFGA
jgi:hypothetical protein